MKPPRPLAFLLPAATALVAVALSSGFEARAGADGATTKSFPDKNFTLTVPKGWVLEDPNDDDRAAGYVQIARREVSLDVYASAWYLVRPAAGATLDAAMAEAKAKKLAGLKETDVLDPQTISWAGSNDAKSMKIVGKSGSSRISALFYGAMVDGRYHQLELRAYNGAEDQVSEEFDAVANGYRFLKAPPKTSGPKPTPDGGTPAGPDKGGGDATPAGGGASQRFEPFHLTWRLPKTAEEADKPRWGFGTGPDVKPGLTPEESGILAVALLGLEEGSSVSLQVALIVQKAPQGMTAKGVIANEANFTKVRDDFVGAVVPSLEDDVTVGNWRGAARTFSGKGKDGKSLYIKFYFAVLNDVLYKAEVAGRDGGEQKHRATLQETLGGLRWDQVGEGVRGPWITPFVAVTKERADALEVGTENVFEHLTLTLKKTAAFRRIKFAATESNFASWIYAVEARKDEAYLFVGIQRYLLSELGKAKPPKDPDSFIDDLETEWKGALTDSKTLTQKSGKANKAPGVLSGAKGSMYQFEGEGDGKPFVEHGWVVKSGQSLILFRAQFGGKDAETVFGAEWKAMLKSLKFK